MKDESGLRKLSVLLMTMAILTASVLYLFPSAPASAITPQGKGGEVIVKPTPTPKKTSPPNRSAPAKSNKSSNSKSLDEIAFWETIKTSTDPQDFNAYLKKYPKGHFVDLARNRLNALETAAKATARKEEARPGAVVKSSSGMELVSLPPGNFMMGLASGWNEKPAHQVTINYSFYMGKYEVTQAQWQALMGNSPSKFKNCGNCPVEQVSWDDAQTFINKLNTGNDAFTYRLPTEAEWEYACRAGTTGEYADNPDEMAWFKDNSGGRPHAVGGKQPNAWGLADMYGNVSEWCQDWYHETYYGAPTDGSAWLSGGEQKYRVLRGGSWGEHASNLRPAQRGISYSVSNRLDSVGFRLAAVARTQ